MISSGINLKNFKLKKKSHYLRKKLKDIIEGNDSVLQSLRNSYKDYFNKNKLKKYKTFKNIRIIGMGGSSLGTQAVYDFFKDKINKNFSFLNNLNSKEINEKVITLSKKEIINLVKLQNLVDIRTPSFLNAKLNLGKKNNLVKIKSKIKNIDLVENVYVQQFNKNYVNLRIKYLGKFEKLTNQLKEENIKLQLVDDQWLIKIL